jgi:hypothetical protein
VDSNETAPAGSGSHTYLTAVLLFNGTGISTSDWQTTEKIIKSMGLSYKLANSAQLNAMSLDDISKFGLIVVPGGHGSQITSGLNLQTRLRVRQAVQDRGVNYLGFCAGAWTAVGLEATSKTVSNYGFAAVYGNHLSNWWPNGNTSAVAAVVPVTFATGSTRQLVWWGGPATPEWKGGVIARYGNGKAAIAQAWSGQGFVVISGPHPEAPQGWRATAGTDSDGLDYDIAQKLITAALEQKPLKTF